MIPRTKITLILEKFCDKNFTINIRMILLNQKDAMNSNRITMTKLLIIEDGNRGTIDLIMINAR